MSEPVELPDELAAEVEATLSDLGKRVRRERPTRQVQRQACSQCGMRGDFHKSSCTNR